MMNQWVMFFLSFVMVMSVLGTASLLYRFHLVQAHTSRKLIHIGVAHWIFFVPFFDSLFVAMIAPITFIFLNALSLRFKIVKSMEREDSGDYGTVLYAVVLSIVTYVAFVEQQFTAAYVAMMILGWGDGLATLIGLHFKSPTLRPGKSLLGSLTVGVTSFLVGFIFLNSLPLILGIVMVAVLAELFAPKGWDNVMISLLPFLMVLLYG
jgi:phytol kinase